MSAPDRRSGHDRRATTTTGGAAAAARSGGQPHVTRPYDRRSGDVRPAEWVPHLEAALRYIELTIAARGEHAAGAEVAEIHAGAGRLARVDLDAIRRLIARGRK